MKILILAILALVVITVAAAIYLKYRLNNTPDHRNLEAALDSEVKKLTDKGLAYGLVVGVYKDGKSFIKGYGTVNRQSTIAPDGTTIFQLGSVTKLFTAAALQMLCDEGVLRMEASLGELIGDSVALSPAAQKVTLKELVTHTSGFPRVPKSFMRKITNEENPYSCLEMQDLYEYLKDSKGKRKPGKFNYSNFGMGLLGHVLEMVTKKSYEMLVTETLLSKLDMASTVVTLTPELETQLAQGYSAKGEANPIWTFSLLAGAGAFNSNAADIMKFIRANLKDSSGLSRSLKKMHAKQGCGVTGIGWIQAMFLDRSIVWHDGGVGGYASYLSIDAKNKTGLVVLSNKSVSVTMLGIMLTRQVRTQLWST